MNGQFHNFSHMPRTVEIIILAAPESSPPDVITQWEGQRNRGLMLRQTDGERKRSSGKVEAGKMG